MTLGDVLVTVTPAFGVLALVGLIGAAMTSERSTRRHFLGMFVIGTAGFLTGVGIFIALAFAVGA